MNKPAAKNRFRNPQLAQVVERTSTHTKLPAGEVVTVIIRNKGHRAVLDANWGAIYISAWGVRVTAPAGSYELLATS